LTRAEPLKAFKCPIAYSALNHEVQAVTMSEYFSIMEEVSKRVTRPYASESETRFILGKDNNYIELRFGPDSIEIQGWVGGGISLLGCR
jgi:hypothetical protein